MKCQAKLPSPRSVLPLQISTNCSWLIKKLQAGILTIFWSGKSGSKTDSPSKRTRSTRPAILRKMVCLVAINTVSEILINLSIVFQPNSEQIHTNSSENQMWLELGCIFYARCWISRGYKGRAGRAIYKALIFNDLWDMSSSSTCQENVSIFFWNFDKKKLLLAAQNLLFCRYG